MMFEKKANHPDKDENVLSKTDQSALLDYFQKYLSESFPVIENAFKQIESDKFKDFLPQIDTIFKELKSAAFLLQMKYLGLWIEEIEKIFSASHLSSNLKDKELQNHLVKIVDILKELQSASTATMPTWISNHVNDFKSEIEFLQTYSVSPVKKAEKEENREREKKNLDLKKLQIFFQIIQQKEKELNACMNALESLELKSPSTLQEFFYILQFITKEAEEISIFTLLDFFQNVLAFIKILQKKENGINPAEFKALKDIITFLRKFDSVPIKDLNKWVENQKNSWIEAVKKIAQPESTQEPVLIVPLTKAQDPQEKKWTVDSTLFDLFRVELEANTLALSEGLLNLESDIQNKTALQTLMRAAHSIKGAARVIQLEPIVELAHALEDCFMSAQSDALMLEENHTDLFLEVVDLFSNLYQMQEAEFLEWIATKKNIIEHYIEILRALSKGKSFSDILPLQKDKLTTQITKNETKKNDQNDAFINLSTSSSSDRFLRVTARNLNRLMGLAGEFLVESRSLHLYGVQLNKLKKQINVISNTLDEFRDNLNELGSHPNLQALQVKIQHQVNESRHQISDRIAEYDMYMRNHSSLSERLYGEVIDIRMRPFSDGVKAFPRMVRDLARQLNKQVKFEILGQATPVDRDILEKLESPLTHLLRNAVDHGIETPDERIAAGKPPEGTIRLEARHRAGMLAITVSDDGRGVNFNKLRQKILDLRLVKAEFVQNLQDVELLDFLYLPGFTTASEVTEISGRGIGLNVVQTMIQEVGGLIRTISVTGQGTSFHLQLPLTLSVIRCLLVQIKGEPYAFPLSKIDHALCIAINDIKTIDEKKYFVHEGKNIGLISACQIFGFPETLSNKEEISVVVLSERQNSYGIVVDKFIGGKELVVQELDPLLGKVPNVSSGAFMESGFPLLIVDIEDMIRSIDKILVRGGAVNAINYEQNPEIKKTSKRVLIVDDSITVREVECRLLENQGYEVETAVNGMDGWNAIRTRPYDLVITDVDMPRMNGIELVKSMKRDPRFHDLPVMIVSYKDRDEDRRMGLEAGANYYLTKSSFHDETLINAVEDLIGKA